MIKIEQKGYHDFTLDSNSEKSWFESDQAGCAGGRCSMQPPTAILLGRRAGNRSSDQALSVVARGGQDSAGDIPADAPHRGAVVVELASLPDLKPAYTEITKIIALGLVYFCGHSSQFFFSHRLHSK